MNRATQINREIAPTMFEKTPSLTSCSRLTSLGMSFRRSRVGVLFDRPEGQNSQPLGCHFKGRWETREARKALPILFQAAVCKEPLHEA